MFKKKYNNKTVNSKNGFSLLELSIIISTVATLTIGFLNWQSPAMVTNAEKYKETKNKVEKIGEAIEAFRISNNRLPCPADPFIRPDNSRVDNAGVDYFVNNFGFEDLDITNEERNSKQTLGIDCPDNIGSLPVFSLNLGKEYIVDAWGNKFTYHVSDSLCGSEEDTEEENDPGLATSSQRSLAGCTEYSYRNNNGNIIIKDENNNIILNKAAYVIVSYGANGLGSTKISGITSNMPVSQEEAENADEDNEYILADQSENFDDILLFKTRLQIEKNIATRDKNFLSVEACNDNSNTIKDLTKSELSDLSKELEDYEHNFAYNIDKSILSILNTVQSSCIKSYGIYPDNETGWIGAQCYGNNDISVNGSTFDPKTGACKCADGKWDGDCTMEPKFIAVGDNGVILTSSDGKMWISQNSETSNDLNDIIYDGTRYIAVGGNSKLYVLSSYNTIDWEEEVISEESNPPATSIANNNEVYIIAGELSNGSPPPLTLTNYNNFDSTWNKQDSGVSSDIKSIIFANGTFFAATESGKIINTPKGISWDSQDISSGSINKIIFNNEYYIAVGDHGKIYKSATSKNNSWTEYKAGSNNIHDIAYGNGTFVAVSGNSKIIISQDSNNWLEKDIFDQVGSADFLSVTFNYDKFIAVGTNSKIITSYDGSSWEEEEVPYSNYNLNKIISLE